jgi:hypothetical protein
VPPSQGNPLDLTGTAVFLGKSLAITHGLNTMTEPERKKLFDALSLKFCFDCGRKIVPNTTCNCP